MKKVVVTGGGTGSYTVLSGLKKYPLDLTAIVTVADSGGSTGRLRDEFGVLPVGDFRMALVALADTDIESEILRKLFLYRFDRGDGLKGHNFGNLFLVAMANLLGSYEKALESVSQILRIKGTVLPITSKDVTLLAEYEDGSVLKGEAAIDEPPLGHDGTQKISHLWIEPAASVGREAASAILDADLLVFGPGDLYSSIFANLVVDGVSAAIKKSSAKILYVANLMTKYGQTYGFSVGDHAREVAKYVGRTPDFVLLNSTLLPQEILEKYEAEHDFPVGVDTSDIVNSLIIKTDLLAPEEVIKPSGDVLKRSLIRHDSDKVAWEIFKILKEHC